MTNIVINISLVLLANTSPSGIGCVCTPVQNKLECIKKKIYVDAISMLHFIQEDCDCIDKELCYHSLQWFNIDSMAILLTHDIIVWLL